MEPISTPTIKGTLNYLRDLWQRYTFLELFTGDPVGPFLRILLLAMLVLILIFGMSLI